MYKQGAGEYFKSPRVVSWEKQIFLTCPGAGGGGIGGTPAWWLLPPWWLRASCWRGSRLPPPPPPARIPLLPSSPGMAWREQGRKFSSPSVASLLSGTPLQLPPLRAFPSSSSSPCPFPSPPSMPAPSLAPGSSAGQGDTGTSLDSPLCHQGQLPALVPCVSRCWAVPVPCPLSLVLVPFPCPSPEVLQDWQGKHQTQITPSLSISRCWAVPVPCPLSLVLVPALSCCRIGMGSTKPQNIPSLHTPQLCKSRC